MEKPIEPVEPKHPGYFDLVHPTKKSIIILDIFSFIRDKFSNSGNFSESEFDNKSDLQTFVVNNFAEFISSIPEDVKVYVCHDAALHGSPEEFYIKYKTHNENYEQEFAEYDKAFKLYHKQVVDYEKDIITYNEAIKVYNKEIKAYQKEQDKIAENERYLAARKVAEENLTKYITKHKDNLDPEVIKKLVSML